MHCCLSWVRAVSNKTWIKSFCLLCKENKTLFNMPYTVVGIFFLYSISASSCRLSRFLRFTRKLSIRCSITISQLTLYMFFISLDAIGWVCGGFRTSGHITSRDFTEDEICHVHTGSPGNGQIVDIVCHVRGPTHARYVYAYLPGRDRYLTLCEVEVYEFTGKKWELYILLLLVSNSLKFIIFYSFLRDFRQNELILRDIWNIAELFQPWNSYTR